MVKESAAFIAGTRQGETAAQLCLTLGDPIDCSPPGSPVHGDFPGKNAGVGCHALLQEVYLLLLLLSRFSHVRLCVTP